MPFDRIHFHFLSSRNFILKQSVLFFCICAFFFFLFCVWKVVVLTCFACFLVWLTTQNSVEWHYDFYHLHHKHSNHWHPHRWHPHYWHHPQDHHCWHYNALIQLSLKCRSLFHQNKVGVLTKLMAIIGRACQSWCHCFYQVAIILFFQTSLYRRVYVIFLVDHHFCHEAESDSDVT